MTDYSNGYIYRIDSQNCEYPYIGSSTAKQERRHYAHKLDYKLYSEKKSSKYVSSFEVMKYGDTKFTVIEKFPCENKKQLEEREGYWQRQIKCVNKYIAGRSKKQYREEEKDKIKAGKRKHYLQNKEKITQKCKEYVENNREKVAERKRRWAQANKERLKEKRKIYAIENADKIKANRIRYRERQNELYREKRRKKREAEGKEPIKRLTPEEKKAKKKAQNNRQVICEFCSAQSNVSHIKRHQRTKACQAIQHKLNEQATS